jgi:outer membrane protein assembly factor BamB
MKVKRFITIITAAHLLTCTAITAQDWPQYLGPDGNSKSPQKGLLRSWPESGPEVLWTANVGAGYGGPAVRDGKVYLLDRDDEVGDIMRCFNLQSGEELWKYGYDAPERFPSPAREAYRLLTTDTFIPADPTATCTV